MINFSADEYEFSATIQEAGRCFGIEPPTDISGWLLISTHATDGGDEEGIFITCVWARKVKVLDEP